MKNFEPIKIDGETIYISGLRDFTNDYIDDGIRDLIFQNNSLETALKPILSFCGKVKTGLQALEPDETELTLQLSAGISNGNLAFAICNVSAEAQIAIKYTWKKDKSD